MSSYAMTDLPRPWLCPDHLCRPLVNQAGRGLEDITKSEPGSSFVCLGRMTNNQVYKYDKGSIRHRNNLSDCIYTPAKGLIRFYSNINDWKAFHNIYGLALVALDNEVKND